MRDEELMARAARLGVTVRRRTSPNPWVGCVIVRDGEVVGEGATAPPGGPHAEAQAIAAAGERARGATAYVTLEPCAHHGRTAPCADALRDAGIGRVVVAVEDPDPNVSGRGIARLREHGVAVDVGVGAIEARKSLSPYLHHRRTGRAYCLLKTASSLDGRVAAADGTSRWITGPAARVDAHHVRADSQAIVVGSGTALLDRPALTVRLPDSERGSRPARPPLRVVLDARGRVPANGPLFEGLSDVGPDAASPPTLVITSEGAAPAAVDAWRAAGAKVEVLDSGPQGGVDLHAMLALLGREGVLQAMVEGGPTLHGALLDVGVVDHVVAYVAGTVLGPGARPVVDASTPATLAEALRFELLDARIVGDDIRLDYAVGERRAEDS